LKTSVELTDVGHDAKALIEDLADETLTTITIAERLSPGAARINLIPTMPLHVAFYFGARMRQTHAREIVVHAMRQGGDPPYFPATSLRVMESAVRPLIVDPLEAVAVKPDDTRHAALLACRSSIVSMVAGCGSLIHAFWGSAGGTGLRRNRSGWAA